MLLFDQTLGTHFFLPTGGGQVKAGGGSPVTVSGQGKDDRQAKAEEKPDLPGTLHASRNDQITSTKSQTNSKSEISMLKTGAP